VTILDPHLDPPLGPASAGDAATDIGRGVAAPVPAVYDAAAALARAQGFFPQFPLSTLADRLEPVVLTPPPPPWGRRAR
jgi:hypothetical protein